MTDNEMSLDEAIEAIELAVAEGKKNAAMLLEHCRESRAGNTK